MTTQDPMHPEQAGQRVRRDYAYSPQPPTGDPDPSGRADAQNPAGHNPQEPPREVAPTPGLAGPRPQVPTPPGAWTAGAEAAPGTPAAPGAPGPSPQTPQEPGIVVDRVSRAFGAVQAVAGMSLVAPRGAVTALVGPNGCGKSTLMLMLASLLAPDSGTVRICGIDPLVDAAAVRTKVGWMPDQFGTWDSLRVQEVLSVVGGAYFMPREQIAQRTPELLAELDLEQLATQRAHVLSRGQKQRLGLARALMHRPEVLVLDEPASGLDPASRRNLQRIVREFAAAGGTVLISSHILSELEEMADNVVFMDHGTLVDQSSVRDLARRVQPWRIESLDAAHLRTALEHVGITGIPVTAAERTVSGHAEAVVLVSDESQAARLVADLVAADARVVVFAPASGRLESAYLSTDAGRRKGAL